MELIGWKDKFPRVEVSPTKVRGVGMAIAMQGSGIPLIDMASATVKLNDGGFYNLLVGATDIGQKSDTILGQIVAEELETTLDKVIVTSSDTDLTPFDTGAYASSTTYVSGNAAWKAAKAMKAQLIEEASDALQIGSDDVKFDGTRFWDAQSDKEISLIDLSNHLYYNKNQKQLMVTESFVGHKSPPPFMAGFAEVEVDKQTGETSVLNYVSVVDCGTTINPVTAKGQVEGGIVQGIGMALYEEVLVSKTGKLITNDFMAYKIPTRLEIKNLITEFADSYEETGPFGAKSVAEIGIDTPPAAVTNAIFNAVGVRITDLPATAEKIWKQMQLEKEQNHE
jgi:CO/xanthine dehydrogenase Mo-binding subunit